MSEPTVEEPASDEPTVEDPAVEPDPPEVDDPPAVDDPAVDDPGVEEPAVEEPDVEEPDVEQPPRPMLAVRAAMAEDETLRPRVAAAIVGLAVEVISEPTLGEGVTPLERATQARRRAYALDITNNVPAHTIRSQWGVSCWFGSDLVRAYEQGGTQAITDEALLNALVGVWTATGGG